MVMVFSPLKWILVYANQMGMIICVLGFEGALLLSIFDTESLTPSNPLRDACIGAWDDILFPCKDLILVDGCNSNAAVSYFGLMEGESGNHDKEGGRI